MLFFLIRIFSNTFDNIGSRLIVGLYDDGRSGGFFWFENEYDRGVLP